MREEWTGEREQSSTDDSYDSGFVVVFNNYLPLEGYNKDKNAIQKDDIIKVKKELKIDLEYWLISQTNVITKTLKKMRYVNKNMQ